MWRRRKPATEEPEADVNQTVDRLSDAIEDLEQAIQRVWEPILTLEQRYPANPPGRQS